MVFSSIPQSPCAGLPRFSFHFDDTAKVVDGGQTGTGCVVAGLGACELEALAGLAATPRISSITNPAIGTLIAMVVKCELNISLRSCGAELLNAEIYRIHDRSQSPFPVPGGRHANQLHRAKIGRPRHAVAAG